MAWTNPATMTADVSDILASDWNTYVRDDLNYLKGQAGTVAFEAGATFAVGGLAVGSTTLPGDAGGIRLQSTFPQVQFRDTDAAIDATGLMRLDLNGGNFELQKNTHVSVEFSTTTIIVSVNANGVVTLGGGLKLGTVDSGYLELPEITAPAGATDKARLYAVVDGGLKTDLLCIFQSGAAQTVAQEP